ncbi:hypothetical protein COV20_00740 [Candidatus Woesearchaeota archaeon CG10_big_fil_rev_8_21_14_0_10_45_16]|nr:MAG: hypothetical protein COV20_00740 [Candidatus Woesearchaeota archaeon CG10_big_fil_rev_8_21_14_0_10_45_16]
MNGNLGLEQLAVRAHNEPAIGYNTVNEQRRQLLTDALAENPQTRELLQRGNVAVFDRNYGAHTTILYALAEMVDQAHSPIKRRAVPPTLPHHSDPAGYIETITFDPRSTSNPYHALRIYGRLKADDSALEKAARDAGEKGLIRPEDGLTVVRDLKGATLVGETAEDAYALEEHVTKLPFVARMIERKDYYENPKASGYKALHATAILQNGYQVELHFVDDKNDALNNTDRSDESRSHQALEKERIQKLHTLAGGSVVIVNNLGTFDPRGMNLNLLDITDNLPNTEGMICAYVMQPSLN